MTLQAVLIDGNWRPAKSSGTFQAENPKTRETLAEVYPVSTWEDCDAALSAAAQASAQLREFKPEQIARFLERFAERIEEHQEELVAMAHAETGLPTSPRLADVELPRTTGQMRQAAQAARNGSWRQATIDTGAGIRSYYAGLGPVAVFGPNNFPFAFGSISGGDFVAAVAAGNPVIAKANSSHPGTTRLFAEQAQLASAETGMPTAMVQLLYRTSHADGERLVADARLGATGYTGSRSAGLKLKAAADAAGKPIYLELSSVNPVVILPGALRQRGESIADEFTGSCLMGTGQFCTNPGIVFLVAGEEAQGWIDGLRDRFLNAPVGTLLSKSVQQALGTSVQILVESGAELLTAASSSGEGYSHPNSLLRISGQQFLAAPEVMQTEAFGNESLLVLTQSIDELAACLSHLEGNLTGCIYSDTEGADDDAYQAVAGLLRCKVGRLLNDKMPTGVAVSPAMNHGGPYPATGHPGFTAVGIPASLLRFAMLQSFDNVRPHRLPQELQDANPTGDMWRLIDGQWSQAGVS